MATDFSPGHWETVFAWEDPPELLRRQLSSSHELAARLRTLPGSWARVGEYPSPGSALQRAGDIAFGIPSAFRPAGAYEAVTRGPVVWARYREQAADEASAVEPRQPGS